MKYAFLLTVLAIISGGISARAQSASAEDSVRAAVAALFTGMKDADAGEIRQAFTDSALLQDPSINKDGKVEVRTISAARFAAIINGLGKGVADERIHIDFLRVDGPMALVWAPYTFFFKGSYHHCGVDTFQLVRTDQGWKIQYVMDTERKNACPAGAPDAP
jgi:hypothetical protein